MKKTTPLFEIKKSNLQQNFPQVQIKSSVDAYGLISQFYGDDIDVYESFFILLLNHSNKTIGYAKISQGGVAFTVIDNKIIAKYAIDALATGVIVAHNHPSGNLTPSKQDLQLTHKLRDGLDLLDIKLLDHLILTSGEGNTYKSFADEGYL
jgi:DNA repair protein RadC